MNKIYLTLLIAVTLLGGMTNSSNAQACDVDTLNELLDELDKSIVVARAINSTGDVELAIDQLGNAVSELVNSSCWPVFGDRDTACNHNWCHFFADQIASSTGSFGEADFVEVKTMDATCSYTDESSNPGVLLNYNFAGDGAGTWGLSWNKPIDISTYSTLVFRIRGNNEDQNIQITFEDSDGEVEILETQDILSGKLPEGEWISVYIDLNQELENTDLSHLQALGFAFNSNFAVPNGTICIDDVELLR